jgi:hypothetical protein
MAWIAMNDNCPFKEGLLQFLQAEMSEEQLGPLPDK